MQAYTPSAPPPTPPTHAEHIVYDSSLFPFQIVLKIAGVLRHDGTWPRVGILNRPILTVMTFPVTMSLCYGALRWAWDFSSWRSGNVNDGDDDNNNGDDDNSDNINGNDSDRDKDNDIDDNDSNDIGNNNKDDNN